MIFSTLASEFETRQHRLSRFEGKLELVREELGELQTQLSLLDEKSELTTGVLGIFQSLEEQGFQAFEERIAALISRGTSVVFNEPMDFVLEGKTRGDLAALEFKLVQRNDDGGILTTEIMGAKGGGVVAVVGFLLRILILLSHKPTLRPILVLDETFAHLSAEYVPNMADLLRQLCDETGIQLLLITHEPAFGDVADRVYEVSQHNGQSEYRLIKGEHEHVWD